MLLLEEQPISMNGSELFRENLPYTELFPSATAK